MVVSYRHSWLVLFATSYLYALLLLHTFFSLRQMDIQFMKRMHGLVNLVPIIAKADSLTPKELKKIKDRVNFQ